jgi:hypothetical protein
MATATGHGRGNGGVLRVAGVVASPLAEAEVKARTDATGRASVLARPGSCLCALWRVLARLGASRSGLGRASLDQRRVQVCSVE